MKASFGSSLASPGFRLRKLGRTVVPRFLGSSMLLRGVLLLVQLHLLEWTQRSGRRRVRPEAQGGRRRCERHERMAHLFQVGLDAGGAQAACTCKVPGNDEGARPAL